MKPTTDGQLEAITLLKNCGFLVYSCVEDIPDSTIEEEYEDRDLTSDYQSSSKLIDELESRGYTVRGIGEESEEEYSASCVVERLEELYFKRLVGHDIMDEVNELILTAANRIV